MVQGTTTKLWPGFLVHVQRHNFTLAREGASERTLFIFWQRAFNTHRPEQVEKISINNPSDRQKLRCVPWLLVVVAASPGWKKRGKSAHSRPYLCLFSRFRKFNCMCVVNIHWTLSLPCFFRWDKTGRRRRRKKRVFKSHCQSSRRSLQLWHRISIMINYT